MLGSAATTLPVLGAVSPARRGEAVAGLPGALSSATPRSGLSGHALTGLRIDAVALEQRGGLILAAARREALGRVAGIGYEGTWRWRMEGGPGAVEAHRAWWSLLVRSVARPAPILPVMKDRADPAPYAGLVASLGPAVQDLAPSGKGRLVPDVWLLGAISGLLVLEWALLLMMMRMRYCSRHWPCLCNQILKWPHLLHLLPLHLHRRRPLLLPLLLLLLLLVVPVDLDLELEQPKKIWMMC